MAFAASPAPSLHRVRYWLDRPCSIRARRSVCGPPCSRALTIQRPARGVEVVYTTKPVPCGVDDAMLVKAYRLAAARYDGEDSKTQNQIIMEG